jgi:hypothetical protein
VKRYKPTLKIPAELVRRVGILRVDERYGFGRKWRSTAEMMLICAEMRAQNRARRRECGYKT